MRTVCVWVNVYMRIVPLQISVKALSKHEATGSKMRLIFICLQVQPLTHRDLLMIHQQRSAVKRLAVEPAHDFVIDLRWTVRGNVYILALQ